MEEIVLPAKEEIMKAVHHPSPQEYHLGENDYRKSGCRNISNLMRDFLNKLKP